jgi:hypothetical protein
MSHRAIKTCRHEHKQSYTHKDIKTLWLTCRELDFESNENIKGSEGQCPIKIKHT